MRCFNFRPGKNLFVRLFVSLIVIGTILLVVETVFRAYIINPATINAWGYNADGLGDLLPNKHFVAVEVPKLPYFVSTNDQGFRATKNYKINKDQNIWRIMAIGDSFTFGAYVSDNNTYPAILQSLLPASVSAEVINAGVSSYTLEDETDYLISKGIKMHPDLVLVGVVENDVSDYLPGKRGLTARKNFKARPPLLASIYNIAKQSAILNFLERSIALSKTSAISHSVATGELNTLSANNYQAYYHDLNRLQAFADANQVKLVFVIFPSFNQLVSGNIEPQSKIIAAIPPGNIVVNLFPVFSTFPDPELLYLLPNNHPSALGYYIAAQTVTGELLTYKLGR